jgi:hypothetical protein
MPKLYAILNYLHIVSNLLIPLYMSNVEGMWIEIFIHTQNQTYLNVDGIFFKFSN